MINSIQIQEIVGRNAISEHAMAEIIELGATEGALLEAYDRVVRGDAIGSEALRPASPIVLKLCEILEAEEKLLPGEPDA